MRGGQPTRRRLLAASSLLGPGSLAGCSQMPDHETAVPTDPADHGAPCELPNVIVNGGPEVASLSIINAHADESCD